MTLLGIPGSSYPRDLVSAARPSVKESVAELGLNHALPSGGIPSLPVVPSVLSLPRPLPKIPNPAFPRSSPELVLDISPRSHYTTTDTSTTLLRETPLTTPPNLTRLYTLSLPSSPLRKGSADAAIRLSPPPLPFDPVSPITPLLLTPAPVRPTRRWGMTVFPRDRVVGRVSSAPSSPISLDNTQVSPTSIIAIKSPVERRDSAVSLPQEKDVPPVPAIPLVPSVRHPISPAAPTLEESALDIDIELSSTMSKISKITLGKGGNLGTIEESSSPPNDERKQPRSPQVEADPRSLLRASGSHNKRISSINRQASSMRRPNRRLMLKRDSGAPFAHHVATATAASPTSAEAEIKEGQRNAERRSASRKLLQASTKRPKATVVMMRKGKEKVEEKDIITVIPQLRELKTPRWLRS